MLEHLEHSEISILIKRGIYQATLPIYDKKLL